MEKTRSLARALAGPIGPSHHMEYFLLLFWKRLPIGEWKKKLIWEIRNALMSMDNVISSCNLIKFYVGMCSLTSDKANDTQIRGYRLRSAKKSVDNMQYWKNAEITAKMRGENGDIWEFAGPFFPQSCSDLSYVSEWVLWMCGGSQWYQMIPLWDVSRYSTKIQTASSSKKWKKRAKNGKSRFAKNAFLF